MKRLTLAILMGVAALSGSAQVNYKIQTACNPMDVKHYDTERLRSAFVMDKVMVNDEINLTYSMYDRFIFGGAVPATKELVLETIDPLKAPYFLFGRELGVINVGGDGIVSVDGKEYTPCGFSFTPPSSSGRDGKLTVDDTSGELTYTLQLVDSAEVAVSVIDAEDPSNPLDGPVYFKIDSFSTSSDGSCSLTLSVKSKTSYGLSKYTYSARIFPGLFG